MYTQKQFNDDLYRLTQSPYYVKFQLLKNYAEGRINQQDFINQLAEKKAEDEIGKVLNAVNIVLQKLQQNCGKFDEDPIDAAKGFRKEGKLKEAFQRIVPYLRQNQENEDAKLSFGWIMYDYLKQSEDNFDLYCRSLRTLNDHARFDFNARNSKYVRTLLASVLWSIRRVASKGEMPANKVFVEFMRFVGHSASFIERRGLNCSLGADDVSSSRPLLKELQSKLNERNYFVLMDMIGFDWFDFSDYAKSSFTGSDGRTVEMRPLAETALNSHAKKLIKSDEHLATRERISAFLPTLTRAIASHPDYEWLPYYKIKLLIKLGDSKQAFSEVTEFARSKSRDFWVWDFISDLTDGEEKFNCLCAGLLCNSKAEMIVGLQEKSIPRLVDKGLHSEAKHVLDKLVDTRMRNGWKIPNQLLTEKERDWYKNCEPSSDLDALHIYAIKAKLILYRELQFSDVFVTYINSEKGAVSFLYIDSGTTREGFFYKDSVGKPYAWKANTAVRLKMIEDKKRGNLFNVFDVEDGDESFAANFVKRFSGTFEKIKDFGFIRDGRVEIFINHVLVNDYKLLPFSTVSGTIFKKFDKKKGRWGWQIISIDKVEEPVLSDFEKDVSGVIAITMKGFGFLDECYVPAELIQSSNAGDGDYIKAKAQKSWDRSKDHWSWKIVEIIAVRLSRKV